MSGIEFYYVGVYWSHFEFSRVYNVVDVMPLAVPMDNSCGLSVDASVGIVAKYEEWGICLFLVLVSEYSGVGDRLKDVFWL